MLDDFLKKFQINCDFDLKKKDFWQKKRHFLPSFWNGAVKFQVNLYGRLVTIYNVHTQLGLGKEYALELRQKYQKETLTKFSL